MEYCKVSGCRHPTSHVTIMHQCGKCKIFAHGQVECQTESDIKNLEQYYMDLIPKNQQCTINKCISPHTHITSGHCCPYCGKRQNHLIQCPYANESTIFTDPTTIGYDISNELNLSDIKPGHYITTYGGMGCIWYVRNNNGKLEYLFMHTDSWGQYGENSSDIPKLNCFIKGYYIQ